MTRILIERVGKRIRLTSFGGYDPSIAPRCKRIEGANAKYVDERFKYWTFPLNFVTCLMLRRQFPDLEIGPLLMSWARTEKRKRDELVALKGETEFDLPKVAKVSPVLAAALADRKYQQVDSAFMAQSKRVLLANSPGTGKTLSMIAACVELELRGPLAVAAPSAAARLTWPEELERWLPNERYYVVEGPRPARQRVIDTWLRHLDIYPNERHWLLCNFEVFRASQYWDKRICPQEGPLQWTQINMGKQNKGYWCHPYADLFNIEYSAFIIDESHKALVTQTSVITKMKQLHRAGLGLVKVKENGLRIAASGTPFRGKRQNLWGTLNWLDPKTYASYWQWVETWFYVFKEDSGTDIGEPKPELEKEFYKELDTIMIRRTKAEVLKDLPPKLYAGRPLSPDNPEFGVGHWLPLSGAQQKLYDTMAKHAAVELEQGTLLANGVLAEIIRLKQFATASGDLQVHKSMRKIKTREGEIEFGDVEVNFIPRLPSNKFDWIVNFLEERQEGKVVIGSQFTTIVDLFSEELIKLGFNVLSLTGKTTDKNRREYKKRFQENKDIKVFLVNTIAGGTSLTLDAADDLVIIDEMWDPDAQEQLEDRIHRVSRMHQVTIHYLRSLGTIEEKIAETTEGLDIMQKKLLDGRRGIAYARRLLNG